MAQFYFLSILANIVAGLTLAGDYLGAKVAFLSSFKNLRDNKNAVIGIGAAAALIGLIKLFVLSPGEIVPVAGDLLPAVTGMALGGLLLVEAFREKVEAKGEKIEKISQTMLTFRVPLGIVGVVVGVQHFLIPGAPVL
jgi:hypothetical protein